MSMTPQEVTSTQRWLITIVVMSATLMQLLDTTIINVALPHMQGSLGATPDQITWVLTSYLVASAIFMPLTGYFSDRYGRKNFLLLSIAGFIVSSLLCGAATSITQIVIFRLLQGIFGAGVVPLSQAILVDIFPEEERGKAMAIFGIGIMVGPILGPTLGGYLTEIADWRWNFYINLPVGIIVLIVAWYVIIDTPRKERQMNWIGLILLSTGIGATQYFLDRGNRADWFNSYEIQIAAFLAIVGWVGFITYSLHYTQNAVFDLKIFKDRNYSVSSLLITMAGIGLFGALVVLPLMLERLLNYPVLTTGLVMAPRGISGMIGMMVVASLIKNNDPRYLIIIGVLLCIIGTYAGTYYNLMLNAWWIIWPLLFQGFGLGMIFVPLSSVAFRTLPVEVRAEAAGIFNLLRTLGSSIGVSIVITIFTRRTQESWNELGGFIQPYNSILSHYLDKLHLLANSPRGAAVLSHILAKQAQMIAFVDVYVFIVCSFICMLPFVFLIGKSTASQHEKIMLSE